MSTQTQPTKEQKIRGIVTLLAFVFIIYVAWSVFIPSCSSDKKAEVKEYSKQDAVVYSRIFVEKMLVSPGSADFPYVPDDEVQKLNDSTFYIESYVDSQNKFGALLRSNYKCKIIFTSDSTARCEDMIIQ